MGVSDRDWQKQNYDKNMGRNAELDLSKTKYNSSTGELELSGPPKKLKRPTIDYLEKIYKKPEKKPPKKGSLMTYVYVVYAIVIGFAVFKFISPYFDSPITNASPLKDVVLPEKAEVPQTVVLSINADLSTLCVPFSFYAPSGGGHYYFKLKNTFGDTVLTGFCRDGETLQANVPIGKYRLCWVSGTDWKNEQELFGRFTTPNCSTKVLDFFSDNEKYIGHAISMVDNFDGNLHSQPILLDDF